MTENKTSYKKIAIAAARLADAKKAEAVTVYDMAGRSELADYVVVVTVDNPAQLEAVDDEITINLKKEGLYALYRDGMKSKNWKVLDYGGIIVHIFEKQTRELYSFDKVYAGYSSVKWEENRVVTSHKSQVTSEQKDTPQKVKAAPKKAKAAPKKAGAASKKAKSAPKKAKPTPKKPAAKKGPVKKAALKKAAKKAPARKAAPKKKTGKKKK